MEGGGRGECVVWRGVCVVEGGVCGVEGGECGVEGEGGGVGFCGVCVYCSCVLSG